MRSGVVLELLAAGALVAASLAAECPRGIDGNAGAAAAEGGGPSSPARASPVPPGEEAGTDHDAATPPIDCPLRAQGIDPAHLRPFEDVARYIAFLERPDRAAWQRPDAVVSALDLAGTETLYDLGAGSGYFSFRFARALPRGKVIAADTEAETVRHVHHQAMTAGVSNVEARLIRPEDPAVPGDADLVFVCDVLHHVPDRPEWLGKIATAMRSGAKLVLVEFREGDLPEGPPESVKIPRHALVRLVTDSGLALASERADLLPYQTFLVFQKP
jgi:SAM-dependent methyltransferase